MQINSRKHLLDNKLIRPDWTESTKRSNMLLLDKNENNDPKLLHHNKKLLKKINIETLSQYPDCSETYFKIAKTDNISPHEIFLGHGSDGVIRCIFEAFIEPGDKVVITKPTFAMYPIYSKIYNANTIEVEYEMADGLPKLDLSKVINIIRKNKIKLLCLPNPDSPTGCIIEEEMLYELLHECSKNGTLVLLDEAYYPFYPHTAIGLVNDYDNLIITRTFAKAWGLAGLRIGYGVGNKNIIQSLHKIKSMYESSTIAVNFLNLALDNREEVQKSIIRLIKGKKWFVREMEKLGFNVWRANGNFCHIDFNVHAKKIHNTLRNKVAYKIKFDDPCLKNFSRFSSTTVKEFKIVKNEIIKAL